MLKAQRAYATGTSMPMPEKAEKTTVLHRWQGPTDGPMQLSEIKMMVVVLAIHGKFFQPLKSFLRQMRLEWGTVGTACAYRRNKEPIIQLGRGFFADKVKTTRNGAIVVLHEIMHHLMLHLRNWDEIHSKGYSNDVINVAEDAIINAYLAYVNCASFMEEFYPDEGYYAFLRPHSQNIYVLPPPEGSENRARNMDDPGAKFYRENAELKINLDQSLEFFDKYFKVPPGDLPMLGSHGQKPEGEGEEEQQGAGKANEPGQGDQPAKASADKQASQDDASTEPGGLFGKDEASQILRSLGIGKVSQAARDNFKKIIATIKQSANRPGPLRENPTFTRRVPFKLTTRDLINIERGRELFQRRQYMSRTFDILLDVSGSVERFIPFVVGLVRTLQKSEHVVRVHCWADGAEEVALSALGTTAQPAVGSGTNGEMLAKYIKSKSMKNAVIITDNAAGTITTKIDAIVYLCLFPQSDLTGSFIDKKVVPHCRVHKLRVDDQYNW